MVPAKDVVFHLVSDAKHNLCNVLECELIRLKLLLAK